MKNEFLRSTLITFSSFAVVMGIASAWNAPVQAPTGGNPNVPIHTGSQTQTKAGGNINLSGGGNLFAGGKVYSAETTAGDPSFTTATKGYVDSKVAGVISATKPTTVRSGTFYASLRPSGVVSCYSDEVIVGGGVLCSKYAYTTFPTISIPSGNGWFGTCDNAWSTPSDWGSTPYASVYAICMKK